MSLIRVFRRRYRCCCCCRFCQVPKVPRSSINAHNPRVAFASRDFHARWKSLITVVAASLGFTDGEIKPAFLFRVRDAFGIRMDIKAADSPRRSPGVEHSAVAEFSRIPPARNERITSHNLTRCTPSNHLFSRKS